MPAAQAADQSVGGPARAPSSYYPDSYYPRSIDWTGFYTGLEIGGGWASATWTDPFSGLSNTSQSSSLLGGGQVGVNWQRDSLLFGVEADFDWVGFHGSAIDGAGFFNGVSAHWLSTVTGRLGYAFNRWLAYAKGGIAFASERDKIITPAGFTASSGTSTQYGWTAGGGLEYALDSNWSARVEYDFLDFPSQNIVMVGPVLGASPVSINYTIQKLVGGVNYRF